METIESLKEQFVGQLERVIMNQARLRMEDALGMIAPPIRSVVIAQQERKAFRKTATPGRVLHGKYIGALRGLSLSQKRTVKLVRNLRGKRAAIRLACSWKR